ncbi:MAG TPA: efflux RND transporter periplasmic adaptor subunit [Telluria sp.]|nr:efflux RND transporter periplasmic adaptor subunit [Telluria sp.]
MKRKVIVGMGLAALLCVPVIAKFTRSEPARIVETEVVAVREVRSSILASGHLAYQEQVLLSPEVIGKVSAIYVKEGERVKAGDLLLHLDDQTYRAQLAQQQAAVHQQRINIEQQQLNLANQKNQFKRKVELHKMKMLADSAIDDARFALDSASIDLRNSTARLQQAEAVLNQSREQMAKTKVRAPISGTITSMNIKVGETAVASQVSIAGSSLMTIANTDSMITEVNVDETDIAKIALGQEVAIHTAAYPEVAIKGVVQEIPLSPKQNAMGQGGNAAALSRTYSIKVRLTDTKGLSLRPGLTCRAEIYTAGSGKSLAVPLQAVMSNNDDYTELESGKKGKKKPVIKTEYHVFVNKAGKAEKRVVTVGVSDDSRQEILSGVKAGEPVITGPYKTLRFLKPGDQVTAATTGSTEAAAEKPAS